MPGHKGSQKRKRKIQELEKGNLTNQLSMALVGGSVQSQDRMVLKNQRTFKGGNRKNEKANAAWSTGTPSYWKTAH